MASFAVKLTFNDGSGEYIFPLAQTLDDPVEGMKATVIDGNRGDGCIVIPAGKKSVPITVVGFLYDSDGYEDITSKIASMRTAVTTDVATLALSHQSETESGLEWVTDWSYTVRRLDEIRFTSDNFRTQDVQYTCTFLVIAY